MQACYDLCYLTLNIPSFVLPSAVKGFEFTWMFKTMPYVLPVLHMAMNGERNMSGTIRLNSLAAITGDRFLRGDCEVLPCTYRIFLT